MDLATSQIVSNIMGDVNGITIAAKYASHSRLDLLIYYGKCDSITLLIMDVLNKSDRLNILTQTTLKNMLKNQVNSQIYGYLYETLEMIIKRLNDIFIEVSMNAHVKRPGIDTINKLQHYAKVKQQIEKLIKIIKQEKTDKTDESIMKSVKNALNNGWNSATIIESFYAGYVLKTDVNKIRALLGERTTEYKTKQSNAQQKTEKRTEKTQKTKNGKTNITPGAQKTKKPPIWERQQQAKQIGTWIASDGKKYLIGTHVPQVDGVCNNFQIWNECVLKNMLQCKESHTCTICKVQYHGALRCPQNPYKLRNQ